MMLLLVSLTTAALAQSYRAPFADAHYGYFYPTAYYDHAGVDWACGGIRYSGHRGNDFGGGSWSGMSAGRDIVAAADGTVVATHDGEFDECSTGDCAGGSGYGNYVSIQHDDGKKTYYAHLKKWSIIVSYGQRVSCGQKLGQMGSSGHSTGPHLHFEPRTTSNVAADPFDGPCSSPPSYWVSQGGHGGLPAATCETRDNDGDGYDADRDCDDNNRDVHPGAREVCDDGVDNDCSGGDAHSEIWYDDDDGDGYGDDAVTVCGSPPGDAVRASGDCDDSRRTVNPGASELCDGLDNDCNGEVDEGNPTVMGDPPPALAAQLVDFTAPGVLGPGEGGEVWFVFRNVGDVGWSRGQVWLRPYAGEAASPLLDEGSWAAWDVLATLDADTPVGGTGVFRGRLRAPEDAAGTLSETFLLTVDDQPMRCPEGEVAVDVRVRGGAAEVAETPAATGCSHAPGGLWGLLALLALRRRR
ncbi:MAG: peptidoglycan DD-metalloendopeptidase family protein [Alphaproteobacteria bacterium]|nr:peptidoglycan DD-metalloendopeptidase family protein [Alphaproteobacteria bacterium]